jgi:hypothetical protein
MDSFAGALDQSAARDAAALSASPPLPAQVRPVYKVVCEGVMNLADKFFEMERADAVRGLEVYKVRLELSGWFPGRGRLL